MKDDDAPEGARVLLNVVDGPIQEMVDELGESPEAWRGMFLLLDNLRSAARTAAEVCLDMGSGRQTTLQTISVIQAAALVAIDRHPSTEVMRQALGHEVRYVDPVINWGPDA